MTTRLFSNVSVTPEAQALADAFIVTLSAVASSSAQRGVVHRTLMGESYRLNQPVCIRASGASRSFIGEERFHYRELILFEKPRSEDPFLAEQPATGVNAVFDVVLGAESFRCTLSLAEAITLFDDFKEAISGIDCMLDSAEMLTARASAQERERGDHRQTLLEINKHDERFGSW